MATAFAPYSFAPFDRPSERGAAVPADAAGGRPLLIDLAAPDAEAPAERREAPGEPSPDAGPLPGGAAMASGAVGRAELEAAVSDAEHRTRLAVEQAAEARVEQRLAEAVERLADQLAGLRQLEAEADSRGVAADVGLALEIARSIVPHALAHAPLADLEAMLVELLQGLGREPRLELRVAPVLVEGGRRLIHGIAERTGWQGGIEVVADDGLSLGDARLIWAEGRAERRLERIAADMEEVLASVFAARPSDDPAVGSEAAENMTAGGECR